MALTFQKIGTDGINIFWESASDIEAFCIFDESEYRYIYRLFKDNVIYNTFGPTFDIGRTYTNLPPGSYNITIESQYEAFGTGTGYVECFTYDTTFDFSNIVIQQSFCIPSNATNLSMSNLAKFYGLDLNQILLSGPNNPSTSGSLFGNSDLPNSGTISKTRPNAMSELRGSCGGFYDYNNIISNPTPVRTIIVGNSGTILTSTNGTTWTPTNAPNVNEDLVGVSTGSSYRFAVGNSGRLIKSNEGVFWNIRNSGTSSGLIDCDRLVGTITRNLFVGVGGIIRHSFSDDLDTWAIRVSNTTESLNCVRFMPIPGITAIVVGSGGVIRTSNTDNYDSWTTRTSNTTQFLLAIGLNTNNNTIMVAGGSGTVRTSTNAGVTWTTRDISTSQTIRGLAFARLGTTNRWVAVGSSGVVYTSDNDGVSWTFRTSGTSIQFNRVVYDFNSSLFIAVGLSGIIRTSPDGITWTARTSGTTANLNDVKIYNEGVF